MKNQENMTPPKENNNFLLTDPEEMDSYELLDKEFKIIVLWKINKLQENIDRQLNKIRKTIHEQKRSLTKK